MGRHICNNRKNQEQMKVSELFSQDRKNYNGKAGL